MYKFVKLGMKLIIGKRPLLYSLVDVEDLCSGIYAMATRPEAIGEKFYLTSGSPIEFNALQELIGWKLFGKKYGSLVSLAIPGSLGLFAGSMMELFGHLTHTVPFLLRPKILEGMYPWYCSCEKAQTLLGWRPKYNVLETVVRAGKWYQEHGII